MPSERSTEEMDRAADALPSWLDDLRLGALQQSGPLAVVPVYGGESATRVPYRTLAEALASGEAMVTEQAQATVPTLQVLNQSALPILILDGEEVVGGRQNRVVNTTLLIPAKTAFDLPVTCVEHGRWHQVQADFGTGEAVHPSLRRQKVQQVSASFATMSAPVADQGAVWAEVETRHRRTGTHSDTSALRDAYLQRGADLTQAERALHCPEDGPTGVVALVGGRALCADLFDRPETLRHYWTRLVRSYALEAVGAEAAEPRLDSAQRLLQRPAGATRRPYASPGLGVDLRVLGNGVVGAALVVGGGVLHAALFRRQGRQGGASSPLRSPGERARRLGQW